MLPWATARSKRSARANRISSADRRAMARALPAREAPPCAPTLTWSMPNRSSSPIVWANSRAVTVTSCPRARMRAIIGRKITTWGEFVMSIQTRIGAECRRAGP